MVNELDDLVVDEKTFEETMDELEEENKKYNSDLKKRSKKRDELIVSVDCLVKSVNGYTHQVTHTPASERKIGGRSPSYRTGDSSYLEIDVETNTPIKNLYFNGLPPIEKGDTIKAYVFKGKEEFEKELMGSVSSKLSSRHYNKKSKSFLVERDFEEKENPLKIEKLRNGIVVATYHIK